MRNVPLASVAVTRIRGTASRDRVDTTTVAPATGRLRVKIAVPWRLVVRGVAGAAGSDVCGASWETSPGPSEPEVSTARRTRIENLGRGMGGPPVPHRL